MRKLFFVLFIILLSSHIFSAEKYTGSLIWKISGNGLKQPSFIIGTHHLIPPSFFDSIPSFTDVWNAVENVVGEADLSNKELITKTMQSYMHAYHPDMKEHPLLSEFENRELEKLAINTLNLNDMNILFNFKPSALSLLYIQSLQSLIDPAYNPLHSVSMDQALQTRALKDNKSVGGLETIEEQAKLLFDYHSYEVQMEQLVYTINNHGSIIDELKTLKDLYLQAKLWDIYFRFVNAETSPGSSKEYIKALNEDRNTKWLQAIPDIMSKTPSLFVVGALHLSGDVGLLYKLNEMGYTVEALK